MEVSEIIGLKDKFKKVLTYIQSDYKDVNFNKQGGNNYENV